MSTDTPIAEWERAPVSHWREAWGVPELHLFAHSDSTNNVIRRAALAGALAGTCAIADHQSAGRGRLGRPWIAPPGQALLLSLLLRPAPGGSADAAGTVPVRVGLLVAKALEALTAVATTLKWPNDVLAGDAKLAGILCEAVGDAVVVGIGINVGQQHRDFVPELQGIATSIRILTGREHDRALLAGAVLDRSRLLWCAPHRPLDAAELAQFAARDALAGRRVAVDGVEAGIATGIDPLGALLVEGDHGRRSWYAGTVRRLP